MSGKVGGEMSGSSTDRPRAGEAGRGDERLLHRPSAGGGGWEGVPLFQRIARAHDPLSTTTPTRPPPRFARGRRAEIILAHPFPMKLLLTLLLAGCMPPAWAAKALLHPSRQPPAEAPRRPFETVELEGAGVRLAARGPAILNWVQSPAGLLHARGRVDARP
jgi:hypothetical protein